MPIGRLVGRPRPRSRSSHCRQRGRAAEPSASRPGRLLFGDEMTQSRGTGTCLWWRDGPFVLVDFMPVAVVLAAALDCGDERIDAFGVELRTGTGSELGECSFLTECPTIRPGRGHCVERVGDVDDRRLDEA